MGSRRSGLKRAIEKLFIRTIGKTTNETPVYFSTYKNCEKKMRCRIRRLWIFHLNRPLMYASTNNKSLLHERLVRLFIYRENTREIHNLNSTIHHVPGAVSIVFRMNAPCHFCFWQNARWVHMAWHISLSSSRRLTIFFILCARADEFLMPFYYPLVVKIPLLFTGWLRSWLCVKRMRSHHVSSGAAKPDVGCRCKNSLQR